MTCQMMIGLVSTIAAYIAILNRSVNPSNGPPTLNWSTPAAFR